MNKNPWDIKKVEFLPESSLKDKIKHVLGYAILAPSTHNSQPWLFKIKESSVEIYYDPHLRLPEADPIGRDLYISIGCMLENLEIAARYFGIFKRTDILLKNNLVAEVFFGQEQEDSRNSQDPLLPELLGTITRRVNARGVFEPRKIPGEVLRELAEFSLSVARSSISIRELRWLSRLIPGKVHSAGHTQSVSAWLDDMESRARTSAQTPCTRFLPILRSRGNTNTSLFETMLKHDPNRYVAPAEIRNLNSLSMGKARYAMLLFSYIRRYKRMMSNPAKEALQ